MRKNFLYAENIDLEIMWLHALGLDSNMVEDALKQNNGIWAPDSGPCDTNEPSKICELQSGSKLYTWGQRNKEKLNC